MKTNWNPQEGRLSEDQMKQLTSVFRGDFALVFIFNNTSHENLIIDVVEASIEPFVITCLDGTNLSMSLHIDDNYIFLFCKTDINENMDKAYVSIKNVINNNIDEGSVRVIVYKNVQCNKNDKSKMIAEQCVFDQIVQKEKILDKRFSTALSNKPVRYKINFPIK